MTHYALTVPVSYTKDDEERTRYTRVGAVFENVRRETGEIGLTVKLDVPVGATSWWPPAESRRDGGRRHRVRRTPRGAASAGRPDPVLSREAAPARRR